MDKYQQLQGFDELLLLNVWNVNDTPFAFYQVVDLQKLSVNQTLENIRNKC
ncbi:hypothetical protein WN55_02833 [Dufourea novaeangliae]|uniref:Uncharacterized protein n=1 Tax=Dufourea novaeangliae TaxID=178035 RepID=A0A154PI66_DUFNO|nr:hypothetical protein WN55_02833 [Dufourea novaeangliae]